MSWTLVLYFPYNVKALWYWLPSAPRPVPEAYPVPGAVCPDAGCERRYAATPPTAIATTEFENPSVLAAVFETPPVLVLGTDGSAATKA